MPEYVVKLQQMTDYTVKVRARDKDEAFERAIDTVKSGDLTQYSADSSELELGWDEITLAIDDTDYTK